MTDDQDGSVPAPDEPERVTVTMAPKGRRQLAALQGTTRLTRTDLINRAVNLYAFVAARVDDENPDGPTLALRWPDGRTETVHVP